MIVAKIEKYDLIAFQGKLECTCPDFRYRKRECKHIKKWKAETVDWEEVVLQASEESEADEFRQAKIDRFDY